MIRITFGDKMDEIKINLEDLLKSGNELSSLCKGQCGIYINAQRQTYCSLTKYSDNINCRNLYNFSFFRNACLFSKHNEGYN